MQGPKNVVWRNAVDNGDGSFECQVNHPEFGWIDYLVVPGDTVPLGQYLHAEMTGSKKALVKKRTKPLKTPFHVNMYRDQRIQHGNTFRPEGYGENIRLTGDPTTQMYLFQRTTDARMRVMEGRSAGVTYRWRDADNKIHTLSPAQMIDLGQKAITWFEQTIIASWSIKDDPKGVMDDFDKDPRWP